MARITTCSTASDHSRDPSSVTLVIYGPRCETTMVNEARGISWADPDSQLSYTYSNVSGHRQCWQVLDADATGLESSLRVYHHTTIANNKYANADVLR